MKKRIPSLDGLRAFSILLVVISHSGVFGLNRYIDLGNLGVRFFFIISSYLITGILYESATKSKLNLRRFYFKRILRTFPAFYFYLVVTASVLIIFGLFDISQFWRAPLYLENYHPRSAWTELQWFVGHSWSLAVEEQFYLLSALLFYANKKSQYLRSKISKWFFIVLLIIPGIRIAYIFTPGIPDLLTGSLHRSFETVADSLAIGGLAYLFRKEVSSHRIFRCLSSDIFIILLFLSIFTLQFMGSRFLIGTIGYLPRIFYNGIGITIMQVGIALLMIILINIEHGVFRYVLNHKSLVLIGTWSYSIYLWQQIWFFNGWSLSLLEQFIGIVICSGLTYYYIELPAIKWRDSKLNVAT